jgi:Mg2+-importing ATPase
MLLFGPLSSVFDFLTFAMMLWVFDSGPRQFRSGWFVESLATQTLIIFAVRTRRVPFFRSHPSLPLTLAALGVVTVGAVLPATPLAHALGFRPLPGGFFAALVLMVVAYLALVELGKRWFYRPAAVPAAGAPTDLEHRFLRRPAARFSSGTRLTGASAG